MITTNIPTLQIHKLTEEQYEAAKLAGTLEENALYMTPEEDVNLTGYATEDYVNTKFSTLVGDTTVADQISTAISSIPTPTFSATDDGNGNVAITLG